MMDTKTDKMDEIVSLCKRRGFVFPSAEIYGGAGAVFDFGPLGVLLKNNIKALWWRAMLGRDDIVGLDAAILTKREVLKASGHEKGFVDPLVECKKCHKRFRTDHINEAKTSLGGFDDWHNASDETKEMVLCSDDQEHQLTEAKPFNLMFKTNLGPVDNDENLAYLRPETAQGIFTNFKNILEVSRLKIPFGIAQIGKAFRNEITTGNFIFRLREFEQMELEYFVSPKEAESCYKNWVEERFGWYQSLGIRKENLRLRPHKKEELAHYAMAATDVEYNFPFSSRPNEAGWSEIEGIANRGDFDLLVHQKASGRDLTYFDEQARNKYLPYIIEPSAGVERIMLMVLVDGYEKIESKNKKGKAEDEHARDEGEVVLHLDPKIAPVKAAVFPLVNKEKLPQVASEIYEALKNDFIVQYDDTGSIGRRYRRQDEIGTPWCITIDFQTLKDKTVTVRDRDNLKQERVKIKELAQFFKEKF